MATLDVLRSGRTLYYSMDASAEEESGSSFPGEEYGLCNGTLYLARQTNAIVPSLHSSSIATGKIGVDLQGTDRCGLEEWGGRLQAGMISEFTGWMESIILKYPEEYMGIYGDTVSGTINYREVKNRA